MGGVVGRLVGAEKSPGMIVKNVGLSYWSTLTQLHREGIIHAVPAFGFIGKRTSVG